MARKRKNKRYFVWESLSGTAEHDYISWTGKRETDTTTNITYSMMTSPAFKDLTARQRMLYIYAKSQFWAARSRPSKDFKEVQEFQEVEGRLCFYLNHALLSEVYSLYPKSNHRDLYKDIQALIEHGFIERVTNTTGKDVSENNHMRNIYRYSDGWKSWGKM